MDQVQIPKTQVRTIDRIAAGVHGLRLIFVNVFAIIHENGSWTLIDAGLPYSARFIASWAEKSHRHAPNAIVLTHGHFDHAGAARELAELWNIPVYAHSLELPYLTGKQEYPRPNMGAGGGLMSLLSPLYPRGPVDLGSHLRSLPEGDFAGLAEMPGWQMLQTPGHTPGHISLFRPSDRLLIAGDAFCTTRPESFFDAALLQPAELHGPPAYFTWNWNLARQSVERLATLNPQIVAPGHGQPLAGTQLPVRIRELALRFEEVAVPDQRGSSAA